MDSKTTEECDVLIVGGGPAGLSVAAALPDDVTSIVVHQDREIGLPVRTSGGSFLADVQRLGIPPDLYQVISRCEAYADDVHVTLPLKGHTLVILAVTRLYRWLAAQSDHKAREMWLGHKFVGASRLPDGRILANIRDRDGAMRAVRARFVVDASGWHLAVLKALGLRAPPQRRGIGIEYEYPLGRNAPDRCFLFVGDSVPAGYGWGFPTPEGTFRLGVGVLSPDTDASPRALIDALLAGGAAERFGIELSGPRHVNGGILPSVPYDPKLVFGNVIRVGDSANFATPTVGEGIRICIEFGRELGQALGISVRTGRRWPLWRYEWRCRRRLQRDYRLGFAMNRRIATYTPAQWRASIERLGRTNPDAVAAVLRSEFPVGKIARMAWNGLKRRARARLPGMGNSQNRRR